MNNNVVFGKTTKKAYNGNVAVDGCTMLINNAKCDDLDHLRNFLKRICADEVENGTSASYMIFNDKGFIVETAKLK